MNWSQESAYHISARRDGIAYTVAKVTVRGRVLYEAWAAGVLLGHFTVLEDAKSACAGYSPSS
jgi:hypothetical protein